jgi:hypothetical protein
MTATLEALAHPADCIGNRRHTLKWTDVFQGFPVPCEKRDLDCDNILEHVRQTVGIRCRNHLGYAKSHVGVAVQCPCWRGIEGPERSQAPLYERATVCEQLG